MTKSPFQADPFVALLPKPLGSIFDIRFTRFVLNIYIPYLWTLTIITCFLGWGFSVIMGLNALNEENPLIDGFVTILVATIALPFSLLFSRMAFELFLVLFRIETHLRAMREKTEP